MILAKVLIFHQLDLENNQKDEIAFYILSKKKKVFFVKSVENLRLFYSRHKKDIATRKVRLG
jgi:hypothetical protein